MFKRKITIYLLFLFASCEQHNQSNVSLILNDDSVFILSKKIDSLKYNYNYDLMYSLADRIKPYCDNFQGSDKSKLPEIYNFCAEMFRRRCYLENGMPYTIKNCKYSDDLIDCCLRAIPICKQTGDTLTWNYTNSLSFLAEAYEQQGKIEESLKLRFEILAKSRQRFTELSDMTAFAYYDIGKSYKLSDDIAKANEYFKKVLRLQKELESKFLIQSIDSIKAFQKKYKLQIQ